MHGDARGGSACGTNGDVFVITELHHAFDLTLLAPAAANPQAPCGFKCAGGSGRYGRVGRNHSHQLVSAASCCLAVVCEHSIQRVLFTGHEPAVCHLQPKSTSIAPRVVLCARRSAGCWFPFCRVFNLCAGLVAFGGRGWHPALHFLQRHHARHAQGGAGRGVGAGRARGVWVFWKGLEVMRLGVHRCSRMHGRACAFVRSTYSDNFMGGYYSVSSSPRRQAGVGGCLAVQGRGRGARRSHAIASCDVCLGAPGAAWHGMRLRGTPGPLGGGEHLLLNGFGD